MSKYPTKCSQDRSFSLGPSMFLELSGASGLAGYSGRFMHAS